MLDIDVIGIAEVKIIDPVSSATEQMKLCRCSGNTAEEALLREKNL